MTLFDDEELRLCVKGLDDVLFKQFFRDLFQGSRRFFFRRESEPDQVNDADFEWQCAAAPPAPITESLLVFDPGRGSLRIRFVHEHRLH